MFGVVDRSESMNEIGLTGVNALEPRMARSQSFNIPF